MDHIKLETFITVADTGSINKAAEQLNLAPVSIKRQLDSIENEIGTQLLIRNSFGTQLTEAGKIYYDFANNTLSEYQNAKMKIKDISNYSSNTLLICTGEGYSSLPLDLFTLAFLEKYPAKQAIYLPCSSNTWFDLVKEQKADCAFVTSESFVAESDNNLKFIPLYDRKFMLIIGNKDALASKSHISISDLMDRTIHFNVDYFPELTSFLFAHNVKVKDMKESPTSSVVFNIVSSGELYLALEPLDKQYTPLLSIPFDYPPINCGWLTHKQCSQTLKDYIELSKIISKEHGLL